MLAVWPSYVLCALAVHWTVVMLSTTALEIYATLLTELPCLVENDVNKCAK